jgi:predicted methyltransferase
LEDFQKQFEIIKFPIGQMKKIILSKNSVQNLLNNYQKKSIKEGFIFCDFNLNRYKYEILPENEVLINKKYKVRINLLKLIEMDNTSYLIEQTEENETITPLLKKSKEGITFKLCEPNIENNIIGPILEINGMKMHVTKGYKTTYDFSKKLANSSLIKKGGNTLDLFFGLGYSSNECVKMGSNKVVSFEKYSEVVELVKLNEKFSIPINSKNLKLFQNVDLKTDKIFDILSNEKIMFDNVIIDPPKMVLNYYNGRKSCFMYIQSSFLKNYQNL